MVGVELLLAKLQEWEGFAARHVSLRAYYLVLAQLAVRWRRLELNSWPVVLRQKFERYEDSAFRWWFRLYENIFSPLLSGQMPPLSELLVVLHHFLSSSPMGEYESRLKLLQGFSHLLSLRLSLLSATSASSAVSASAVVVRS